MGISSFALVKRKGTSIAALAYFKLMTHEWNSTISFSLEIQLSREDEIVSS